MFIDDAAQDFSRIGIFATPTRFVIRNDMVIGDARVTHDLPSAGELDQYCDGSGAAILSDVGAADR